jgi:hypothetical protein
VVVTQSVTPMNNDNPLRNAKKPVLINGRVFKADTHRRETFKGLFIIFRRAGAPVFEYLSPGVKKPSFSQ